MGHEASICEKLWISFQSTCTFLQVKTHRIVKSGNHCVHPTFWIVRIKALFEFFVAKIKFMWFVSQQKMKTVVLLLLLLLLLLSMLLLLLLLSSSSSLWFKISCQRDSAASSSNKCVYRICPNSFVQILFRTIYGKPLSCRICNAMHSTYWKQKLFHSR